MNFQKIFEKHQKLFKILENIAILENKKSPSSCSKEFSYKLETLSKLFKKKKRSETNLQDRSNFLLSKMMNATKLYRTIQNSNQMKLKSAGLFFQKSTRYALGQGLLQGGQCTLATKFGTKTLLRGLRGCFSVVNKCRRRKN